MQCDRCLFRGSSIILKYVLNRETNPIKTKFPSFLFLFPPTFSLFYLFLIYFYLLPFPSLASIHVWLSPLNFFFLSFFLFWWWWLLFRTSSGYLVTHQKQETSLRSKALAYQACLEGDRKRETSQNQMEVHSSCTVLHPKNSPRYSGSPQVLFYFPAPLLHPTPGDEKL